jgi:hypothetical protein
VKSVRTDLKVLIVRKKLGERKIDESN